MIRRRTPTRDTVSRSHDGSGRAGHAEARHRCFGDRCCHYAVFSQVKPNAPPTRRWSLPDAGGRRVTRTPVMLPFTLMRTRHNRGQRRRQAECHRWTSDHWSRRDGYVPQLRRREFWHQPASQRGGSECQPADIFLAHLESCRADRACYGFSGRIQSVQFLEHWRRGGYSGRCPAASSVHGPQLRSNPRGAGCGGTGTTSDPNGAITN
jgi:hypothetical protein